MDWTRREFDAIGLTQHPVGNHLDALQERLGGSVILCLDVSSSMEGEPLAQAVVGCSAFVDQAIEADYKMAIVLWNSGVVGVTEFTRTREELRAFVSSARSHGGTNLVPALNQADAMLHDRRGDRVVAIFGDGDLGDAEGAKRQAAEMRARDIRIITCGLGLESARSLAVISSEVGGSPRMATDGTIAESIAQMTSGLRLQ